MTAVVLQRSATRPPESTVDRNIISSAPLRGARNKVALYGPARNEVARPPFAGHAPASSNPCSEISRGARGAEPLGGAAWEPLSESVARVVSRLVVDDDAPAGGRDRR